MAIIINSHRVVFRNPMIKNSQPHEWWAESGLIHWRNLHTGEYGSQTVIDTLYRLKGLNDMIGNSRTHKGANTADEMQIYRSYIDAMILQCQMAKEQGMPNVVKHARQLIEDVKNKRKSRMVVSGRATPRWN